MSWRGVVEKFICVVSEHLAEECMPVSFFPWSENSEYKLPPGRALVPQAGSDLLDKDAVAACLKSKRNIVCGCTFEDPAEEAAARKILAQFASSPNVCVVIAQLLTEKVSRESMPIVMERHSKMLATGADEVLMNPQIDDPEALRNALRKAWVSCELNARRMQLVLDASTESFSEEELQSLQRQHHHLLWSSIPQALMPQLGKPNKNIIEADSWLGQYSLGARFPTSAGHVVQATDTSKDGKKVVLKVVEKSQIFTPGQLEGVYRELRFLSEVLRHPNVTRCCNYLHAVDFLYMVFDFAGDRNLAIWMKELPNQRLPREDLWHCFGQTAAALAYCHKKDIAHRNLMLEHVVVDTEAERGIKCTICDFNSAMVVRGNATSCTFCGTAPFIAPEVIGGVYMPKVADCWSAGILLLEMAGGIGVYYKALCLGPQSLLTTFRHVVTGFFSTEKGCAKVLTALGAEEDAEVLRVVDLVMRVDPEKRSSMAAVASVVADM